MMGLRWITVTVILFVASVEWVVAAPKDLIDQEPMVIVSDEKSHFVDAVGKPLPRPSVPAPLASPVNLLNPDKYEFYTFDVNGELIKRLMTMEEIQSIVANGDSDGAMMIPNTQNKDSEADIQGILENIQGVLSKEIEKNSNESSTHFLDTPDVSSNWNLILPAIFGNTGNPIVPQSKPPSYSMTAESDLIIETTSAKAPKPTEKILPTTAQPVKIFTTTTTTTTTTTARPRTTAAPVTAKPTRVVYPSKTKKPFYTHAYRPVTQIIELKQNYPHQYDPAFTTSTTRPLTFGSSSTAKVTGKPQKPTLAPESVKIISTSTKYRPIATSTSYATRFPARPSTVPVTVTESTTQTQPPTTTTRTTTTTTTTTQAPTTTRTTTTTTEAPTTQPPTTTTTRAPTTTRTTTTPAPTTTRTTTTTTQAPTTTRTTTTTTTQAPTTTTEPPTTTILLQSEPEEDAPMLDPLSQIIQTLNESPSMPEATKRPIAVEKVQPTTENVKVATKPNQPLVFMIPVDVKPEDLLQTIAQNMGISGGVNQVKSDIKPSVESNVEHGPNKVFTNSDLYVDEEEPEVRENPTTTTMRSTVITKRTTPHPIYNRPNGIVQKVEEYITDQEVVTKDAVDVDPTAVPIMGDKMNGFIANYVESLRDQLIPTTTDGYSMLEESLSGILNQVSDSRPHSLPLVEDHRIESKIKDVENPEELTLDEELDKLEGINESDDDDEDDEEAEEDQKGSQTTTTETVANSEKIESVSKNDLPPLEESTEGGTQEDKFGALESLSLIVDALTEQSGSDNDLKEESTTNIATTSELPPTTTPQNVTFVTSIVKETHSVSVHQEKPVLKVQEEINDNAQSDDDEENWTEVSPESQAFENWTLENERLEWAEVMKGLSTKMEETTESVQVKDTSNIEITTVQSPPTEVPIEMEVKMTTTEPPVETTTIVQDEEEEELTEEQPISTTTMETSSEELPKDLQVENLTLDADLQTTTVAQKPSTSTPATTTELFIADETTEVTEEPVETTTPIVSDSKILSESLRKSDLEDATEVQHDEPTTTTEMITETTTKDEELYEKLGETTTAELELAETTTVNEETTTEKSSTSRPSTTTFAPEMTTTSEEIITKAETKFSPTKVRFQSSTTGYRERPSGFKRPGSVFHVKNKPAIRVEQRNPTRSPMPIRLQSAPKDALGLEQSTAGLDPDFMDFTKLCNDLAFSYWTTLKDDGVSTGRSAILSPFGITSMLSMVFLGARGATSGEMNEILKLDDMITFNPHLVFRNVTDSIENLRENGVYTSALVRELFSDRAKGKLLPFYKEKSQQYYAGYVEEANFAVINDIVRRRTNLLIKRHTWGKIMEYLRTNTIVLQGPLAAVTATVFQTDCSKASVADRDGEMFFQMEPADKQRKLVPIPSVVIKSGFTAGYDPELDATIVGMGNGNNVVSTLMLMPGQQGSNAPGDTLERLEEAFMAKPVDHWHRLLTTLMERQDLDLQIPKFTHRSFINGTTLMQRMGLMELFDSSKSDLRGLTANANQDIYLADLLQINTFSTCGEDKIPDSHYKEVYPSPPSQKQLSYGRFRKVSKKMHNPYLSTLPENILSRMHLTADQMGEASEDTHYQRALFDPFYDTKYMEMPLPLRPRQARIPDSPRLKFDKPFLYFVRHNPTGMLLYMGRFNPKMN